MVLAKQETVDQWNKSPETDPHSYREPSFDKGAKVIQWRTTVLTNSAGTLGHPCTK